MADKDLTTAALTSTTDFYALLSLEPSAQPSQITSAYRRTALKYHPDKLSTTATPQERISAAEKFHLLQIAHDVLSDPTTRELYDHARKGREAKIAREAELGGRRREMVRELRAREAGAVNGKRKREEAEGEEREFERELARLAEDGRRRRVERGEVLRQEAEEAQKREAEGDEGAVATAANGVDGSNGRAGVSTNGASHSDAHTHTAGIETLPPEISRTITCRFPVAEATAHLTSPQLKDLFSQFGEIDHLILSTKKIKPPGAKHRIPYTIAVILYVSVVSAHAAVTEFPLLKKREPEAWGLIEEVDWAGGKEPEGVPNSASSTATAAAAAVVEEGIRSEPAAATFSRTKIKLPDNEANGHAKSAPSFSSFKTGANGAATVSSSGASADEVMLMRLKNAERRRMEAKIRKEEEEAAAAAGVAGGSGSQHGTGTRAKGAVEV